MNELDFLSNLLPVPSSSTPYIQVTSIRTSISSEQIS